MVLTRSLKRMIKNEFKEKSKRFKSNDEVEDNQASRLESLPRELLWKIFDYAPQYVFELRLTSRLIKTSLDGYAMHSTANQLIDRLEIDPRSKLPNGLQPDIFMEIPKCNAPLFEMRLKLRRASCYFISRIKRNHAVHNNYLYCVKMNVVNDIDSLTLLKEAMGKQIGMISGGFHEWMNLASKFLEGLSFRKINVYINDLNCKIYGNLLQCIRNHDVHQLSIGVHKMSLPDPVKTLLEFSSLVNSLDIQSHIARTNDRPNFFGVYDADWSQIILQMFSKKLSVLNITNKNNHDYMNIRSADILRKKLVMLEKKVLFATSCNSYIEGLNYEINGYSVIAYPSNEFHPVLSINCITK